MAKRLLLYVIVLSILFVPGFYIRLGLPNIHPEDILILIAAAVLAFRPRQQPMLTPQYAKGLTIPYLTFLLYVLAITLLMSPFIQGGSLLITASVVSVVGMFKPLLLLLVIVALRLGPADTRKIGSLLVLAMTLELTIMYLQQYNHFGVNEWLTARYRPEETSVIYLSGNRVFGTFGNPNDLGTALSLIGTLAFARALFGPGKGMRVASGTIAAVTMVWLVWLAETRQGTACMLGGCLMVLLLSMILGGKRSAGVVVGVGVFFGLIAGIAAIEATPALAGRFGLFTGQTTLGGEDSFMARVYHWPVVIKELGGYILFGKGMLELVIVRTPENGFLTAVILGGFPGLVLYVFMIFAPCVAAWRRLKANGLAHADTWIHAAAWASFVPLVLANIPNTVINNSLVMSVYMIVYGLSFSLMLAQDREGAPQLPVERIGVAAPAWRSRAVPAS